MRKIVLLMFAIVLGTSMAMAQVRTITGRVTDEKGDVVPFATVRVENSKEATSADANGAFTLKAKTGDVIVASSAGFTNNQETVGALNTLTVSIKRNGDLTNVVVTTALGVQRQQRSLGYATTKVGTDELTEAKVTNVGSGLAAKVSGLQVDLTNNGVKPDLRIVLRGDRSILGNNEPLLVVDDIQVPITYLATINPDDVDNVTVLKGGSASALYGSAASNGVIIVTTKKRKSGQIAN